MVELGAGFTDAFLPANLIELVYLSGERKTETCKLPVVINFTYHNLSRYVFAADVILLTYIPVHSPVPFVFQSLETLAVPYRCRKDSQSRT